MKYCPNPRCSHRLRAGSQAEYLDHIEKCGDCGAKLVAEEGVLAEQAEVAVASTNAPEATEDAKNDAQERARMDILTGGFVVTAGVFITLFTYALAWNGGVYLLAWGPGIYGMMRLLRGLDARRKD